MDFEPPPNLGKSDIQAFCAAWNAGSLGFRSLSDEPWSEIAIRPPGPL